MYIYMCIIYILYIYNQRSSDSIFSPFLLFSFSAVFGVTATSIFVTQKNGFLFFAESKFSFGRVDSGNGLGSDRFQHREDLSVSWDAGDET